MGSDAVSALIGAGSALLVTLLAGWIGYAHYLQQRRDRDEALLNALFGELANILEHYTYAAADLPLDASDTRELRLRVRWAMYGSLKVTEEVGSFSFLTPNEVRVLLQLGLRVRNNDEMVRELLSSGLEVTHADLKLLRDRLEYARDTAGELLDRVSNQRPRLKAVRASLVASLPATL